MTTRKAAAAKDHGNGNGNGKSSWLGVIVIIVTLGSALGGAIMHFNSSTMQTMKAYIAVQDERLKALEHRLIQVEAHATEDDHPGDVIAMVDSVKKDMAHLRENLKEHRLENGHPKLREQVARLEEQVGVLNGLVDELRTK